MRDLIHRAPAVYARPSSTYAGFTRPIARLAVFRHNQSYRFRGMAATAKSLDHLVLTVADIPATVKWYGKMLNMSHTSFKSASAPNVERHALKFGDQKINLHLSGKEFEPKAQTVQPGSADLCFLVEDNVDEVLVRLKTQGIEILEGGEVVERTGARGKLRSVYVRDPDGNLIELSNMVKHT